MEYFVLGWAHWHKHLHPSACYMLVFMGGIENIYNTLQICKHVFFDLKQAATTTTTIGLFVSLAANHSYISCRLLARRFWSFDWSARRRPCVGFNTSRQRRINYKVPRDVVPLLSVLVLRLFQDDGINIFDAC